MFERLFPQENTSLRSLAELSGKVAEAASLLSEMVGSNGANNYPNLLTSMLEHESHTQDLFFQTMTQVRSTFTSPIPREDLYTLASHLMTATEHLTSAGHLLSLYKIDRFSSHTTTLLDIIQREAVLTTAVLPRLEELKSLDQYWIDMLRISRQASRTAQAYTAEIMDKYKTNRFLQTEQFIQELSATSYSMRGVSSQIGRIIVQES
ncbi:MAG: phosphate transport regulator [Rothia sp. (in: high G+C Gram-positive bacteria)]|nr:phosphate transport regulator [Rothia sp. (in: high G+C Gram-positive bacteria)]